MKTQSAARCLVLSFLFLSNYIQAQSFDCVYNVQSGTWQSSSGGPCVNTLNTSLPFLSITPDARAGAMGDAGIAISPDANAMHFNDSKLAFATKDVGLSVTYTPWLKALNIADVYLAYLAGYKKLSNNEAIGLSLRYFSMGSINFTDDNGQPLGSGNPNEFEIKASYTRKLSNHFSTAIGGKFIYSNLAAGQEVGGIDIIAAKSGAADISFTYKNEVNVSEKKTDLTIGLALTNLGTKISYTNSIDKDFIPANLGLGAAWKFRFDEFNTLTFAADINKLLVPTPSSLDEDANGILDYKEQSMFAGMLSSFGDAPGGGKEELRELMYSLGMEYWYADQFALRVGYYSENELKGNRKYFTVGLGMKYNVFGMNISYLVPTTQQRNPLDNTLRFSLLFDFEAFSPDEPTLN